MSILYAAEADEATLTPLGSTEAFRLVMTHAHCVHEDDRETVTRLIHAYALLADQVPVFAFRYPPGFEPMHAYVSRIRHAVSVR